MRGTAKNLRHAAGFTLLELVLVLAIIGIVVMMAAPSLGGFVRGRGPADTAAQFVALAHWTRSQSISDGVVMRINIDANARRFWVTQQKGSDFIQVDSKQGSGFICPDGIHIDSDAPTAANAQYIEFDPSGRTDPSILHFKGKTGDPIQVSCESPLDVFHVETASGGTR